MLGGGVALVAVRDHGVVRLSRRDADPAALTHSWRQLGSPELMKSTRSLSPRVANARVCPARCSLPLRVGEPMGNASPHDRLCFLDDCTGGLGGPLQ